MSLSSFFTSTKNQELYPSNHERDSVLTGERAAELLERRLN
jgi:hypothetical protein